MISSDVMVLVGLTGGVATGKSTVARLFKHCGAVIIDADELARDVVQPGRPAWREIVSLFGKGILNTDRTLNRQALGTLVFADTYKLRRLEHIIHPRVARQQITLAKDAGQKDPRAVVIYDVPLLFEAGIDKRVDKIIVITADRETQIARLKKRNGLTRAEALRRIKNQMPLARKREHADYVLDGRLDPTSLAAQVSMIFQELHSRMPSDKKPEKEAHLRDT